MGCLDREGVAKKNFDLVNVNEERSLQLNGTGCMMLKQIYF